MMTAPRAAPVPRRRRGPALLLQPTVATGRDLKEKT
jgi:hypothetical protein